MSQKILIKSKSEDLVQWYTDVVLKAQLIHYSPIKGMMTFLPNSWAIWEQIQTYLNQRFREIGVKNIALPSLINESLFQKEKDHLGGFNPEMFKITRIGDKELTDPYILRPTSEVIVSQIFHDLIKNANSLPMLFNQWVSVFRAEKNPRPFLRNCEFFWQELHGAFADFKQAQEKALAILDIYADLLNNILLIPTLKGEKTPNERFAGASISYTLEAIMPDGQALQCATSHVLGTSFSSAYDIRFQDSSNQFKLVEMISAGLSTRTIGGMIMQHGDDFGLIIPYQIAPVQVVVNTMMHDKNEDVRKLSDQVFNQIKKKYRAEIDISNKSISQKIIQSELTGVPMQIIIGPSEAKTNSLCVYNRIDRSKKNVSLTGLDEYLDSIVDFWKNKYYKTKVEAQQKLIQKVQSYDELLQVLDQKKFALCPWGGNPDDETNLKRQCGATARCIIKKIDTSDKIKCFYTNNPAREWVYFARAY